jgi:hypothetical protein
MKPSKYTPFKAPRLVPTAVVPPRRTGHRKDNAEWGKRMEKELGQIEKRTQAEQNKSTTKEKPKILKMMSEREAVEVARHGEVLRWGSDSEDDEVTIAKTIETPEESSTDGNQISTTTATIAGKHHESLGWGKSCERFWFAGCLHGRGYKCGIRQ